MPLPWDTLLQGSARRLQSSAIRDLLAVTTHPEVISFAGGLPAPELFPVEGLRASFDAVFREDGRAALQYGPSEGHRPLRAYLAERLAGRGIQAAPEQILITSGSQQALDLIGKALLTRGDRVLVESPSYVGALQSFSTREVGYLPVGMDDQGLLVEDAAALLAGQPLRHAHGATLDGAEADTHAGPAPSLAYTVATFQNPSGVTMSLERRKALLALCAGRQMPLIEDDPYGELRFEGDEVPAIRSLPGGEGTIYLGTFSKVLAPGLRIGWMVAPKPLIARCVLAKQAADLQSDSLTQRALLHFCANNDTEEIVTRLRVLYRERRDAMLDALARHFPAEARWTRPEGGLFIWVTLPQGVHDRALLSDALAQRVAFVPGSAFHIDGQGSNCLRLSFSVSSPERIEEGIARLSGVVKEHLAATMQPVGAGR